MDSRKMHRQLELFSGIKANPGGCDIFHSPCQCQWCDLKIICILYDEKQSEILFWSGSCLPDDDCLFVLTDHNGNIIGK